jgi:hypothetical protein
MGPRPHQARNSFLLQRGEQPPLPAPLLLSIWRVRWAVVLLPVLVLAQEGQEAQVLEWVLLQAQRPPSFLSTLMGVQTWRRKWVPTRVVRRSKKGKGTDRKCGDVISRPGIPVALGQGGPPELCEARRLLQPKLLLQAQLLLSVALI